MEEKDFNALVDKVGKEAAEKIKSAVAEQTKGFMKEDAFNSKIEEALKGIDPKKLMIGEGDKAKSIVDVVKEQGAAITKFKQDSTALKTETLEVALKSWSEENKDAIEQIKNGQKANLTALRFKAPMTIADNLSGSSYLPNVQVAPGVIDLVRNQPTFWDRLVKGRTNGNPYVWTNKVNKVGNATFIAEAAAKVQVEFDFETESSTPKKVAEHIKVSTELLNDMPGLESVIRDEMRYEVDFACNTAVLTGVASATSPAGVTTIAVPFNLTNVETPAPNNYDAIRAALAQLQDTNFATNVTAYINPVDAANMDMSKATDSGLYQNPPFATQGGMTVSGVPVIVDNNIAEGYLLIGDMTKYRILIHEEFEIRFGLDSDDFTKNLVTIVAERRFHQFQSSNHTGAQIYDTFANIKTAITPAPLNL